MPYTFKSPACADLLMLNQTAKELLEIIGKDASQPGIINAQDIPATIDLLQKAIQKTTNTHKNSNTTCAPEQQHCQAKTNELNDDENTTEQERSVSLSQHAWPFIEMLKAAHQAQKPITWGV